MKKMILIGATCFLTGCAGVHVQTPQWSATGVSLFKEIQIPKMDIKVDDKTTIKIQGYNSTSDSEAMGTLLGTALKAAK